MRKKQPVTVIFSREAAASRSGRVFGHSEAEREAVLRGEIVVFDLRRGSGHSYDGDTPYRQICHVDGEWVARVPDEAVVARVENGAVIDLAERAYRVRRRELAEEERVRRESYSEEKLERHAKMTALGRTFPTVRDGGLAGVDPWHPELLDYSLANGSSSTGAQLAGKFLLSVWNCNSEWLSGRFDAVDAVRRWDAAHRAAFAAWCANPFSV